MNKCFKRLFYWILHGVPQIHKSIEVYKINDGELLSDVKAVVTGGGRGLGFSIAKRLTELGANVLIVGRNEENLKRACDSIGDKSKYYVMDVSNFGEYEKLFEHAKATLGKVNCFINNAGVSMHEGDIFNVKENGYDLQFNTNMKAAYFMAAKFIASVDKREKSNLIFISSERSMQCDDIPYGLTKASVNNFARRLSYEIGDLEMRINVVAPGITASDMTGIKTKDNLYSENEFSSRFYIPEEVAEVVAFLVSKYSSAMNGQIIFCNNGKHNASYF